MSFLSFLPIIGSIIDRIIPDRNAREKAKAELAAFEQSGELELMIKQIETNTVQAQHPSIFVAGARPFILWVCGAVFAYHYLIHPLILTAAAFYHIDISHLPEFDLGEMMPILGGLLGLGAFRTYEKVKRVNHLHG